MRNGEGPADNGPDSRPLYWRSRDEQAGSEEHRATVDNEFLSPLPGAGEVDRRRFMKLMGASIAMGSVACTRQPLEKIVPYVRQPEEIVPGEPLFFATAATVAGFATGVLAESHEGRPTKIEGNPDHPASLGRSDVLTQASILGLYDPDRSQTLTSQNRIRTWGNFVDTVTTAAGAQEGKGGAGIRILTGTVTSPSLAAQIGAILERFPEARWYRYEPAGINTRRLGARDAFGDWVSVHYDLSKADVVLTLDADLLASGPGAVRYARDFSARRDTTAEEPEMNRLYSIEPAPTPTGSIADHRLAATAGEIEEIALAIAAELGVGVPTADGLGEGHRRFVSAVADDLREHRGRSLVVAGDGASPALHTLVHAVNDALGNLGETVIVTDPVEAEPSDETEDLARLARELRDGEVEVLFVLGCNPVYDAPADLDFASALTSDAAWLRVHFGLYQDETSRYCHWHVPATHFLESWGDARAFEGTATIQQPLIEPLYGGKSIHEVLAVLEGRSGASSRDVVEEHWIERLGGEAAWKKALHDGIVPGTAAPVRSVRTVPGAASAAAEAIRGAGDGMELLLRPDPAIHDGSFANNPWLQECPKPFSTLTWDNALLMSPRDAGELGLETSDIVTVEADGRSLEVPVFVQAGHAAGTVTLSLGYGRTHGGTVAEGRGVDAYRLRTTGSMWRIDGVSIHPEGNSYPLATTQSHHSMENRHLVREASLEHYREHPHFVHDSVHVPDEGMTLYPGFEYDGSAWGMVIDLSACTGCNACLVACQSENMIPTVGKDEVIAGREMHWIRIDRYFKGDDPNGEVELYNQPVPCMHCENAPCEVVCPVAATVHSDEGLNDMIYNRCVGTRYCSNNCPYKVRRFNFFKYADWETPSLRLGRNPDVTVRHRGVMEKCTYCVQRINQARIEARREDREIRDGEVRTACQQACPSDAIVFGDLNDPDSRVSRWKASELDYGLLADLNTRPRTTYLARIKNLNPALAEVEPR